MWLHQILASSGWILAFLTMLNWGKEYIIFEYQPKINLDPVHQNFSTSSLYRIE
jgi:hypothetical protein